MAQDHIVTINLEEPHDGRLKMAISPKSKYIVTYNQKSFVGWSVGIDNNIVYDSKWRPDKYDIEPDFKVSDEKIIIINKELIYDMKNSRKIPLDKENSGLKYEFLTNGDIVACHNRTILIYSSNDNWKNWKCREYILKNVGKISEIVANDKLLVSVNENLFILDLSTFQYWKVLLDKNEKGIDIEKLMQNLTVMNVGGNRYIYSNKMNDGNFIDHESQDFAIIGDIITLSDDKMVNIHSWVQNISLSKFKENLDINSTDFIHIEFQNSNIGKVDYNLDVISSSSLNSPPQSKNDDDIMVKQDNSLDENIFCNVEKFVKGEIDDENQFIENFTLIASDIFRDTDEQKEYKLKVLERNIVDQIVLQAILNSINYVTSSYPTKLNSEDYKYHKVNDTTLILYGSKEPKELQIYTFNTNIKKIQQYCFDIENAIELYDDSRLNYNDGLKKQWINYLLYQQLNDKDILAHYGEKLLKSAIKQNDIELIEEIINKTLEDFKENHDIYALSSICENVNHLSHKYPDFLLKYYDEMTLIIDPESQGIIYNHFDHLHSYSIEQTTHSSIISGIFNSIFSIFNSIFGSISGTLDKIKNFGCILLCLELARILHEYLKEIIYYPIYYSTYYLIYDLMYDYFLYSKPKLPRIELIVPFPNYVTYPSDYNLFKELFFKPESSTFSQVKFNEFYKTWNGEAIVNFKWRLFGRYYYAGIWLLYTIFLICFTLATSVSSKMINEKESYYLLILSITLGFIHLSFEIRQFIWDPIKWFLNVLNWFDLGAYLLPTITSIYWIYTGTKIINLVSISCLLLDIKFIFFFRASESFGIYFAIILGVGRRIFSFLFILFLIIISFAHAFFVLLEPVVEDPNDPNSPWALTTKYHQISAEDGTINPNATLVQEPDEYTNLLSNYPNALLSMFLFLTGDRNSLSAWSPKDNPVMIVLMVMFSFIIVVYLMNLFIGLLNMAIEEDNDRASYLAEKAEILKEIELFYLLPYQRRRKDWFPDIIHYYADVGEIRKTIEELKYKGIWEKVSFPENRNNLSKLLSIKES